MGDAALHHFARMNAGGEVAAWWLFTAVQSALRSLERRARHAALE